MKNIFVFLLVGSGIICFGQAKQLDEFQNILLRTHSVDTETRYRDVEGNPYSNEQMQKGSIHLTSGETRDNLLLRYNWYTSQMEIQQGEDILALPKSAEIDHVIIGGEKYVPFYYLNQIAGYAVEVYQGRCSLFRKEDVYMMPAEEPVSSYDEYKPPRFHRSRPVYFLIYQEGRMTQLDSNKRIIPGQFEPYNSEINRFLKSNRIKLKSEEDLVRLVEYYNSPLSD